MPSDTPTTVADFRSDTLTTPTPEMREAMASAEVGDDVFGEDPTVRRLEETAAEVFGKEAAVYVSSGTQANQISIALHAGRGDEILIEQSAHPFLFEGGAIAWISGAQARTLPSTQGRIDPATVEAAIRGNDEHFPRTKLLCVENTHNMHGGAVVPLAHVKALRAVCDKAGIAMHIDGARIFNAAVREGVDVSEYGRLAETISCCLSKGLGAPVGSLLMSTRQMCAEARRIRKVLGGGMRQAGVIAAAGLLALTEGPKRLANDHRRARELAAGLAQHAPKVEVPQPDTNIVFARVAEAHGGAARHGPLQDALESRGVRAFAVGDMGVRFVLYHQLTDAHVRHAVELFGDALAEALQ